jgi:hypothetical protein
MRRPRKEELAVPGHPNTEAPTQEGRRHSSLPTRASPFPPPFLSLHPNLWLRWRFLPRAKVVQSLIFNIIACLYFFDWRQTGYWDTHHPQSTPWTQPEGEVKIS